MNDQKFQWIRIEYIYVTGISILFGCLFWVIDGFIEFFYFRDNLHFLIVEGPQTYLESIILKVSPHGLFVRFSFIIASILGGSLVSLFISKRKKMEKALRDSEDRFRTIFTKIIDVYYRADLNGDLMMMSPSGVKLLGYNSINEMLRKNISKEFYNNPKDREEFQKLLEKNHEVLSFQGVLKRKDGTPIYVETNSHYVYDQTGKPIAVEGIFRDITKRKLAEDALRRAHDELERRVEERTKELSKSYKLLEKEVLERKQAKEKIKASLIEKETLLSEIHHRVKNNFEIISSLLDMTSIRTENKETKNHLMDARARIHSMALIHEQLYQKDQFYRIDMGKHIKILADSLFVLYTSGEKKINTAIKSGQVYLSVSQAIPCSLALNELIANAFKHGFIKREQGTIRISIDNSADDTVFIRVKDNGDGLPDGIDFNESSGLGLKMAKHLVTGQLKGEMWINRVGGTEVCIQFKSKE